ncbi:hypothetical protein [Prevotella sp.]|uniref:hypothetical protein n=1 Tax=Prevotella sp. TaxID=59823 RepID=UPI0030803B8F
MKKVYSKPATDWRMVLSEGCLMAATGEKTMEVEWKEKGDGTKNADPSADILSKDNSDMGLWDDEE